MIGCSSSDWNHPAVLLFTVGLLAYLSAFLVLTVVCSYCIPILIHPRQLIINCATTHIYLPRFKRGTNGYKNQTLSTTISKLVNHSKPLQTISILNSTSSNDHTFEIIHTHTNTHTHTSDTDNNRVYVQYNKLMLVKIWNSQYTLSMHTYKCTLCLHYEVH